MFQNHSFTIQFLNRRTIIDLLILATSLYYCPQQNSAYFYGYHALVWMAQAANRIASSFFSNSSSQQSTTISMTMPNYRSYMKCNDIEKRYWSFQILLFMLLNYLVYNMMIEVHGRNNRAELAVIIIPHLLYHTFSCPSHSMNIITFTTTREAEFYRRWLLKTRFVFQLSFILYRGYILCTLFQGRDILFSIGIIFGIAIMNTTSALDNVTLQTLRWSMFVGALSLLNMESVIYTMLWVVFLAECNTQLYRCALHLLSSLLAKGLGDLNSFVTVLRLLAHCDAGVAVFLSDEQQLQLVPYPVEDNLILSLKDLPTAKQHLALKEWKLSTSIGQDGNNENPSSRCGICLELLSSNETGVHDKQHNDHENTNDVEQHEPNNAYFLQCGNPKVTHRYHYSCLSVWLWASRNQCPECLWTPECVQTK